jgi:hypothetical protein
MDEQERLALEFVRGELTTSETRMYEHVSVTFRWLMATLFAANGGAIVALLSGNPSLRGRPEGLAWFAAGIILSLIMGILSTFMALRVLRPISDAKGKVHHGLITGDTAEALAALNLLIAKQKMTWKMWMPTYAGLLSFTCFVLGIVSMAKSLV